MLDIEEVALAGLTSALGADVVSKMGKGQRRSALLLAAAAISGALREMARQYGAASLADAEEELTTQAEAIAAWINREG